MSHPALKTVLLATICAGAVAGCRGAAPIGQLRQAQRQAIALHQQNQMLMGQVNEFQQMTGQLQAEKQQLEMANGQINSSLQIANQRLQNLSDERGQLHDKYRTLLTGYPPSGPGLSGSAIERLRGLAAKYPDFEFDAVAGVCRFNNDLLFSSGSDALRPESQRLLQDFSQIMNDPSTRPFKILVVGHTDDRQIAKETTRQRHPTNWDLSAHRATAVVKQLAANGLTENRLGVAGYSLHQPKDSNLSEPGRQLNRRVEIYVLAPEASLASADQQAR